MLLKVETTCVDLFFLATGSESFQKDFILTNFPKHKGALTFCRQSLHFQLPCNTAVALIKVLFSFAALLKAT